MGVLVGHEQKLDFAQISFVMLSSYEVPSSGTKFDIARTRAEKARDPKAAPRASSGVQEQISRVAATQPLAYALWKRPAI